jgi:hypothetical protein
MDAAARDFESLQIKTKSIEQTLLPLVKQVGLFSDHVFFVGTWVTLCERVISTSYYNLAYEEREAKQAVRAERGGGRIGRGFGDIFNLSRRHTETLSL